MSEITLRILVRRNENEGPVVLGVAGSDFDQEFIGNWGADPLGVPEYGLWVWEGYGQNEPDDYMLYGEFRPALASDLAQFVQSNRKELIPHQMVRPGQLLIRELEARGITAGWLQTKHSIFPPHLSGFIDGTTDITFSLAFALEKALGIPAEFWINAQLKYNRWFQLKLSEAMKDGSLSGEALRKSLQEGADHDPQTN